VTSRTTAHQNKKSGAGRCFFSDPRLMAVLDPRLMTVPDFCAPTISGLNEATVLLRLSHNIHTIVLNFLKYRIKKALHAGMSPCSDVDSYWSSGQSLLQTMKDFPATTEI
jgi:hypothetical protein